MNEFLHWLRMAACSESARTLVITCKANLKKILNEEHRSAEALE